MRQALSMALLASLPAAACLLDFDDTARLPCPPGTACLPDGLCVNELCIQKGAAAPFKSCVHEPTSDVNTDTLCPVGHICANVRGAGARCLPTCTPSRYATRDALERIARACPSGNTCVDYSRRGAAIAGVCAEGDCNPQADNCGLTRFCLAVNASGVCLSACELIQNIGAQPPCQGTDLCQPVGTLSRGACVPSGMIPAGQPCTEKNMCMQLDGRGRRLICDRPDGSGAQAKCLPACIVQNQSPCVTGETCQLSRGAIDAVGTDLGICQ